MASEEAQKNVGGFFHHDKTEHPPTDTEIGKTPAGEPRGSELQTPEFHSPLLEPEERRIQDALDQADQYGEEMDTSKTKPQTLLEEQSPFGAPGTVAEPREDITIPSVTILPQ